MLGKATKISLTPVRHFSASLFKRAAKASPMVEISINDLNKTEKNSDILEKIERAYSRNGGLGAALITDIPDFEKLNNKIADWAYKLNEQVPKEELEELDRPASLHVLGYNHGDIEIDGVKMP